MAKSLEIGIFYLLSEFPTHTFEVLGASSAAGAVTACAFKTFLDDRNYFFVGI